MECESLQVTFKTSESSTNLVQKKNVTDNKFMRNDGTLIESNRPVRHKREGLANLDGNLENNMFLQLDGVKKRTSQTKSMQNEDDNTITPTPAFGKDRINSCVHKGKVDSEISGVAFGSTTEYTSTPNKSRNTSGDIVEPQRNVFNDEEVTVDDTSKRDPEARASKSNSSIEGTSTPDKIRSAVSCSYGEYSTGGSRPKCLTSSINAGHCHTIPEYSTEGRKVLHGTDTEKTRFNVNLAQDSHDQLECVLAAFDQVTLVAALNAACVISLVGTLHDTPGGHLELTWIVKVGRVMLLTAAYLCIGSVCLMCTQSLCARRMLASTATGVGKFLNYSETVRFVGMWMSLFGVFFAMIGYIIVSGYMFLEEDEFIGSAVITSMIILCTVFFLHWTVRADYMVRKQFPHNSSLWREVMTVNGAWNAMFPKTSDNVKYCCCCYVSSSQPSSQRSRVSTRESILEHMFQLCDVDGDGQLQDEEIDKLCRAFANHIEESNDWSDEDVARFKKLLMARLNKNEDSSLGLSEIRVIAPNLVAAPFEREKRVKKHYEKELNPALHTAPALTTLLNTRKNPELMLGKIRTNL